MPEEQHRDTVALYTRFTLDQLQFNISSVSAILQPIKHF